MLFAAPEPPVSTENLRQLARALPSRPPEKRRRSVLLDAAGDVCEGAGEVFSVSNWPWRCLLMRQLEFSPALRQMGGITRSGEGRVASESPEAFGTRVPVPVPSVGVVLSVQTGRRELVSPT